jgi:hypothetical protein
MPSRSVQYALKNDGPPWCTTMTRCSGGGCVGYGAKLARGGSATIAYLQYGQLNEVPPGGGWRAAPQCGQLEGRLVIALITGETPADDAK